MPLPSRRTARLRFGRVSEQGASYFVTCCTKQRAKVFATLAMRDRLLAAIDEVHAAADIELLAATVMPEHMHLLFRLGDRLSLGQVIGKIKTRSRDGGRASWQWQEDGFEHRLRPGESAESYAFYLFMNPYCAGLCSLRERWEGWRCPVARQFRFLAGLAEGEEIPAAWLAEVSRIERTIIVGE